MMDILIVDDEPLVLLTLRSLCRWEDHGFRIAGEARNGREALEFLRTHPDTDMVLTDVDMPVMDGLKLAESAAEEKLKADIIFLSSYSNFDYVRRAFKSGAFDYILKSEMNEGSLLELVKRVAEKRKHHPSGTEENPPVSEYVHEEHEAQRTVLFNAILSGSGENIDGLFALSGFTIVCPFYFMVLRPGDMPLVRTRYGNNLFDFQKTVTDLLSRCLPKESGDSGAISFDQYFMFMKDQDAMEPVFELFYKSAWTYLDIGFERKIGGPVMEIRDLSPMMLSCLQDFFAPSRMVIRSRRYIREHFSDPGLGLAKIALYSEVSKNHLSWEFARETGETITDFLARTRVREAEKLLLETNLKIYEIAEKTGYANVETFSRAFKKITGKSPSSLIRNS